MNKRIMVVLGTRPEAIKMAPVVRALERTPGLDVVVVVTAQHRHMLDQVLDLFEIVPDLDLDLMRPGQHLNSLFAAVLTGVGEAIRTNAPDLVLVHGDTTTTLAACLAAFHAHVPVGHVEAGLRTGDIQAPWPEEANRRLVAPLAELHFAPTEKARLNLLREGVRSEAISVTGNTVIDALLWAVSRLRTDASARDACARRYPFLDPSKRLILVTVHRRENFGLAFGNVCRALRQISHRKDVQIVYPMHLNPSARVPVEQSLRSASNVFLLEPQEYLPFAWLMQQSYIVLTDSGGIQEEAPALGKPVLVIRQVTERQEALQAGTAKLVGTDPKSIENEVNRLLDDSDAYETMASSHNPYGDGRAAEHIAAIVSGHGTLR